MGNILYAMKFNVDPAVEQLFGSETRAKVLGVLASSVEPKTGYEISKTLDINPSKVYDVLKRLENSGFLNAVRERSRFKRYFLADEDLRRLFLKWNATGRKHSNWRGSWWSGFPRRRGSRRAFRIGRNSYVPRGRIEP